MSRHVWIRLTATQNGQNHGQTVWKIQWFPLERNLYGHPLAGLLWEGSSRKFYWNTVGKKFQTGNACLLTEQKDYYCLCLWTSGKNRKIDQMWKIPVKDIDLGETTSFLDHDYVWVALKDNVT